MSILDDIRAVEFDRNKKGIFGLKSAILWGHSKNVNGCSPLLYISKPRNISREDFEKILDRLEINLRSE